MFVYNLYIVCLNFQKKQFIPSHTRHRSLTGHLNPSVEGIEPPTSQTSTVLDLVTYLCKYAYAIGQIGTVRYVIATVACFLHEPFDYNYWEIHSCNHCTKMKRSTYESVEKNWCNFGWFSLSWLSSCVWKTKFYCCMFELVLTYMKATHCKVGVQSLFSQGSGVHLRALDALSL